MTKYEKISLVTSVVAIIFSVFSPIITYLIFNPIQQELKYAGRLHVIEQFLFNKQGRKYGYKIEMENSGKKPIDGISIGMMAMDTSIVLPKEKSAITLVPVTPFSYLQEDSRAYLMIDKTLAEKQKLTVIISQLHIPDSADSYKFRVDISSSMGDAVKITRFRGAGGSY